MSKKTNLDQIYEAVRLTREQGIYTEYGFIFGEPNDNVQTMLDTVQLIKNISHGEYRPQKIFGCVPFPGSGLYDWCKEKGLLKNDQDFYDRYTCQDWSLDQIPVNMTKMSDEKVRQTFKETNEDLSQFYIDRMSTDWIKHFSEDLESINSASNNPESLKHLTTRVESGMNQIGL